MTVWSQKLFAASSCPSWDWPQDKWWLSDSLKFDYRLCDPNYNNLQVPRRSRCWWSLSDNCGYRSCKHRDGHISRPSKLQKPPASYQIAPDSSIIWLRWWSPSVTCSPNTQFAYFFDFKWASGEHTSHRSTRGGPCLHHCSWWTLINSRMEPDERCCWFLRWSKLRVFHSMCELRESYVWSNNDVVWIHSPHVNLSLQKHSTCVRPDKVEKVQSKWDSTKSCNFLRRRN